MEIIKLKIKKYNYISFYEKLIFNKSNKKFTSESMIFTKMKKMTNYFQNYTQNKNDQK